MQQSVYDIPLKNVHDVPVVSFYKRLIEPLLVVAVFFISTKITHHHINGDHIQLAIISFLISSYVFAQLYQRRLLRNVSSAILASEILSDWTVVVLILLGVLYVCDMAEDFSRSTLILWIVATPVTLFLSRIAMRRIATQLRKSGEVRTAIIIGVTEASVKFADRIGEYQNLLIELRGFFDDRDMSRQPPGLSIPVTGGMEDVAQYVRDNNIDTIYISLPMAAQPRTVKLMAELQDTTASIYFLPDIYAFDVIQARFDYVGGMAVVAICETPFTGINRVVKRASDVILASIIQILLLPIMACIAIAVKISSPGPVIFKQRRYGLGGEEIIVYKFRSMTVSEDGPNVIQATKSDPRITRVGAFLRKTSLDELPQFINVLQGRMSIVGPRPHALAHNEFYRKQIQGYMIRHKVRPGITGWAQVNGMRGETETLDKMKARIEFDLEYLRRWSLPLDLWIILRTVHTVFNDRNAY